MALLGCFRPSLDLDDEQACSSAGGTPTGSRRSSSQRSSGAFSQASTPASSRRGSIRGENKSAARRSALDMQMRAMGKLVLKANQGAPSRCKSSQDSACFSDDSAFGSPAAQSGKVKPAMINSTKRRSSGASSSSRLSIPEEEAVPTQDSGMERGSSGESMVSAVSTVDAEKEREVAAAETAATAAAIVAREPLFGHPRYKKLRSINRGSHGFVQLAMDLKNGNEVAIKFIKRGPNMQTKSILRELLNQQSCLQHPHIVGLEEVFLTPNHLGIAMQYANGGDLSDYIADHVNHKGTSVPEKEARRIFQQMLVAVHYCHRLGIANRDIKLDNVLLHNGFAGQPATVKLCDFGYSKSSGSNCITACGTPEYMAPEVMSEKVYDGKKVDVWSCGCTLFVMLAGVFPFLKMAEEELPPATRLRKMYPRIHSGVTNPMPKASGAAKDLLSRMLTPDPAKRITMDEVLAHPWVACDMPESLADLNDDILTTSPRTAAQRGVMAAVRRRDAVFGSRDGGFSCTQSEETLVAIVEACIQGAHHEGVIR